MLNRVKSSYPATLDPHYNSALLQQSKELLTTDDRAFDLVDRGWLEDITQQDPASMPIHVRNGMERVLDLSTWLDIYRPEIRL